MRIRTQDRYELKYILTRLQTEQMVQELADYVEPDPYGGAGGRYQVTSLYYDTPDYRAYWEKIDGHRFRRKVRVRVYGLQVVTPDTPCFVEIKQRTNKTLQKRRVIMPYSAADALCRTGRSMHEAAGDDRAVIEEVLYLRNTLRLQPACVVTYDRLALNGRQYDPGLRVTFDTNLQCRVHDLSLLSQSYAENRYFVSPGWCVMEVKVNQRVPYWLTEVINRYRCTLRRVSKYCLALEQSKVMLQRQQIKFR